MDAWCRYATAQARACFSGGTMKTRVRFALTVIAAVATAVLGLPQAADAAPTVSLLSAQGQVIVGATPTAKGRVSTGAAGLPARTEVWTGSAWSVSQKGTTGAGGVFNLPLTYGRTTVGTKTFRLAVIAGGRSYYSAQFHITRLPTSVVLLSAPTSASVGQQVTARAAVQNLGAGRTVTAQWLVNGRWSTSHSAKTNSAGEASVPLTYGQDKADTYKWRLVSTNPYGITSATTAYTLVRKGVYIPTIPNSQYSIQRGPNTTNRVILSYDDCPTSLSAFKATVLAAEAANVGLALLPTGDCLRSGRFDAAFARAHGHHVFNHSVSHPLLTSLSYSGVLNQLGAPGVVTTYGRPPYGAYNSTVARAYAAKGMRIWTWNLDTNDWRGRSTSQLIGYVSGSARAGDSVLMHMHWNGFNGTAIRGMKAGLAARGIQLCRNFPGTAPVAPPSMWC